MIPLNCTLRLLPGHFGVLIPLDQQVRRGVWVLVGTDPDYQGEIGLLLPNEGKKEYLYNTRDLLGYLLIALCYHAL